MNQQNNYSSKINLLCCGEIHRLTLDEITAIVVTECIIFKLNCTAENE